MAEMLVVVGGIASFATISKIAATLVQGCLVLRQLMKDAENAPADVHKLVEEMEIFTKTAEGIDSMIRDVEGDALKTKVGEAVTPALENCVAVVEALRNILAEYERGFQKAGIKAWWEKLKAVKGRKAISKLLDEIERSKVVLIVARSNASDIMSQSQGRMLTTACQSIDVVRNGNLAMSTVVDKSYHQGEKILETVKRTEEKVSQADLQQNEHSRKLQVVSQQLNENFAAQNSGFGDMSRSLDQISAAQNKGFDDTSRSLDLISESQNRMLDDVSRSVERLHSSNSAMSATIGNTFNHAEMILSNTESANRHLSDFEVSQKVNSESLRNIEGQLGNISGVLSVVVHMINANGRTLHQSGGVKEVSSHDTAVQCQMDLGASAPSSVEPRQHKRMIPRWRQSSRRTIFQCPGLTIESKELQEIADTDELTKDDQLLSETHVTVRFTLPFYRRAIHYITIGKHWDPLYERKLRTAMVYTKDSPLWNACRKLDLEKVRSFFDSREASPFMEDEDGTCLAESIVLYHIRPTFRGEVIVHTVILVSEVFRLFEFLVRSCGRGGLDFSKGLVWEILSEWSLHGQSAVESKSAIIRLILDYALSNPLEHSFIATEVNLDNFGEPHITAITQQSQWYINLSAKLDNPYGQAIEVAENSRQMLDDPTGVALQKLLWSADEYSVQGSDLLYSGTKTPIHALLEILSSSKRERRHQLRECCKNRLKLLIGTPRFHRFMKNEVLGVDNESFREYLDICYHQLEDSGYFSITKYARRHGHREILEEVLHEIGWKYLDILELFDKEVFHGVPELFDGLRYQTARESQQQFIRDLCDGAFSNLSQDEIEDLALQISATTLESGHRDVFTSDIRQTIRAANFVFAQKSMPGCWPEDGKITVVPGVDFKISDNGYHDAWCILSWYEDMLKYPIIK